MTLPFRIERGERRSGRALSWTIQMKGEADMLKKILFCLAVLSSATFSMVSLTACNTVEGAGRDISKAGASVQEEAREHKNY